MVSAADGDPAHRRRPVGGAAPGPGRVAALAHEVDGFVRAAVADKRRSPGDDLISLLVRARDQDGLISEDELHGQVMMMLVAGQDPSINSVGNSLHALLAHPGQLAALRDDPTLIGTGKNELLRYESPLPFTSWRGTLEPVEFGEVTVPAEDSLFLCLGAANRDPARFPEPDRLDLHRTGPGHLAFGHGAHYCLGAHVGRMTAEAAVTTVLRRLPGLRPAGPPRWRPACSSEAQRPARRLGRPAEGDRPVNRSEILAELKAMLAEFGDVDPEPLDEQTAFIADLGLDSLVLMRMTVVAESGSGCGSPTRSPGSCTRSVPWSRTSRRGTSARSGCAATAWPTATSVTRGRPPSTSPRPRPTARAPSCAPVTSASSRTANSSSPAAPRT